MVRWDVQSRKFGAGFTAFPLFWEARGHSSFEVGDNLGW